MRTIGTVVRGVRAPIIRQGDDIARIAADAVMAAWKEAGITPCDRDVVAVTESVVARAQGNYASVDQIAADVREKTGGGTVGVAFPILSRNRFSLLLKGFARGCEKIVLLLSYPSDEVGNHLVDWDRLDEAGVNPYSDTLTLAQFREKFGHIVHPFTGVDYIDFYSDLIRAENCEVEVIFGNKVTTLLDYTDTSFWVWTTFSAPPSTAAAIMENTVCWAPTRPPRKPSSSFRATAPRLPSASPSCSARLPARRSRP